MERLRESDPREINDDFTLLSLLGVGAYGNVFVVRKKESPTQLAAIKIWKDPLGNLADFPKRFAAEVQNTENVKSGFMPEYISSNLIYWAFPRGAGEYPWIATQLVAGLSLREVVTRCGVLPPETVWHLGYGIATAIADIHKSGVVHRDLKPDNVLLAVNGPWVIDLGLAYQVGMEHMGGSGLMMGAREFEPPEWWEGSLASCDKSADIFSLGATLLFAATRHGPYGLFKKEMDFIDYQRACLPYLDGLDKGPLRELIGWCLAREADARPPLPELRLEFSRHTGAIGREAFPGVLPDGVTALLSSHLSELAAVTQTWGPAELGWGPAPSHSDQASRIWGRKAEWSLPVSSWVRAPIAQHGGVVVTASLDGTVTVLGADGHRPAQWSGIVNTGAKLHSGPLILASGTAGDTAYVGGTDGRVHAIDLASGQDREVLRAGAAIEGTPVALPASIARADGSVDMVHRLYALSADRYVYYVDLHTDGEQEVLCRLKAPPTGALTMTSEALLVACTDGYVYAIDIFDGEEKLPPLATNGQVLAAPLSLDGYVYVGGTDGILRAVEVKSGHEVEQVEVGGPVHCPLVGEKSCLYVGSGDGMIRAYNVGQPDGGSMIFRWDQDMGHEVSGLALEDGRLYATAGPLLAELDVKTGQQRELASLDSLIGVGPMISGPRCYVAGLSGLVACFSLA